MSRDFIAELPDSVKAIYQNSQVNPRAGKTYFQEQQRTEQTKQRIRETSSIYEIFGENLFTFVIADGRLNLDIQLLNPDEMLKDIQNEIRLTTARIETLRRLPAPAPVESDMISHTTTTLSFDTEELVKELTSTSSDLKEAINRFRKINGVIQYAPWDTVDWDYLRFEATNKKVWMDLETRRDITAIQKMVAAIQAKGISTQNYFYFRTAIVTKPLNKAMNQINWKFSLH